MLMVKLQCLKSQTPCCEWEEYPSPPHHPLLLTTLSPSPPSPPHHPLPLTTLTPSPPSPLTTLSLLTTLSPSPPSPPHPPHPLTTLSTLTTLYHHHPLSYSQSIFYGKTVQCAWYKYSQIKLHMYITLQSRHICSEW